MQRFPSAARRAARRTSILAAGLLVSLFSAAAHSRTLDTLQSFDPALEAPAPADTALAAACRTAARERLGVQRLGFDRPAFTTRDGRQVVRMDLREPGARPDPARLFRAVCVRDRAGDAVQAVIFDGVADGSGPRLVLLPGPTPEMRPREAPTFEFSRNGPGGPPSDDLYYDGDVFGLAFTGFGAPCFGCPRFFGKGAFKHARRHKDVILGVSHDSPRFVVRKPRAKAFAKTPSFRIGKPAFRPGATIRFSFGKR